MSKIISEEVREREMAKIMKKLQDRLDIWDKEQGHSQECIQKRIDKAKQFLKDRSMYYEE